MLLLVLTGVVTMSWGWISQRLHIGPILQAEGELDAAQSAFDRGDLDTAIDTSRQLWAAQPRQIDALILLVRALIYRSYADYDRAIDRETALQWTSEALERFTHDGSSEGDLDVMAIHALALQAADDSVGAARIAGDVLAIDPNHILARIVLGLAYGGVGSHDTALRENQIAVQGSVWQMDAQRALAISYSDLGRYDEAVEAVERAIMLNDNLIALYFERALYAMQLGDADAATVAYFRVLAFDPDNVKARLRLCELSSLLRERDSATRYCQEVTRLAPMWSDGWYQLGREYFLQGQFAAAQASLNRCSSLQVMQSVPISERRFECWYLQGQSAEILGDCSGLLTTYNEFREMAASAALPQTWTYPPEGPAVCLSSASSN
ncbi:MAG: tetratricopeptide repeat protein [Chitinophagaceae bacterium]|nr:tetratricopeptide repeat protein [Anaerolineae bacterium]